MKLLISYIAGLFDGEGCCIFHTKKDYVGNGGIAIAISGAYLPSLLQIKKQFGGSIRKNIATPLRKKTCFQWNLSGKNAKNFIEQVLPYLKEKRTQAKILLQLRDLPPKERVDLIKELKDQKKLDFGGLYESLI